MTRVNCIPVSELVNKHLVAEYRELPRVFKLARVGADGPPAYTLGKGHVTFFYNKLEYCYLRQHELYNEMIKRGYTPKYNPTQLFDDFYDDKKALWNDWVPTKQAQAINRQRIEERLSATR